MSWELRWGVFGLWLTFCDNGRHFGSCLHLYRFLQEEEEEDEVVYVGCATVGLLRRHVVCEVKPHGGIDFGRLDPA